MAQALAAAAIGLLCWAAASDLATRRIPNRLPALLALVGVLRLGSDLAAGGAPISAAGDLTVGLAVLALGAVLFRFGLFGGGDVKLMAAASLWLGAVGLWPFLTATGLAGGALALGYLARIAVIDATGSARPTLPYGVAIAAGGVLATLPPF